MGFLQADCAEEASPPLGRGILANHCKARGRAGARQRGDAGVALVEVSAPVSWSYR